MHALMNLKLIFYSLYAIGACGYFVPFFKFGGTLVAMLVIEKA